MKREAFVVLAALLVAGCPRKNHPPDTPSIPSGPSAVAKNSAASFSTTATDPDNDSVCIRFAWGDGDTSGWSRYAASGESVSVTYAWSAVGACSVRAQAMDRKELASTWSPAAVVQVAEPHAPDQPSTPSGPSIVDKDSLATFWSVAVDQDGDSISLIFDWGDGDTSNWSQCVASGTWVSMTHAWSAAEAYSVRTQACDQNGLVSVWSSAHAVQVAEPHAPDTPTVPSGPTQVVRNSLATFSSSATDPDGDSVCIRFHWGDGDTSNWSRYVGSGASVSDTHRWSSADTYEVRAQAKDRPGLASDWSAPHAVAITDLPPGSLKWRYQTGDRVLTCPAIDPDGVIYVGSFDSSLYALNRDGSLGWRYRTGGSIQSSPAVGSDGTVYVGSFDGYLYALNADGTLKWRFSTGGLICSSPALGSDGTVYFGSEDYYFYALNPDGSEQWSYRTDYAIKSSPAIGSDGTVYVGSHDRSLYAFRPDGTLKWSYPRPGAVCSSPALGADGVVYFGSDDGSFTALRPDGTLKWTYLTGGTVGWASAAFGIDGTIYIGSDDGYLHAIDSSGTRVWRYWIGGPVGDGTPAVSSDGTIYFSPHGGSLYALNPSGTLIWKYDTGSWLCGSAALGPDGTIYFGTDDGCLYAIQGSYTLANTPWPKFHHDSKNTGRVGGGQR